MTVADTGERLTFTPAEVAAMLGVTAQSVRDGIRDGRINAIEWGSRWLVSRREVERLTGETLATYPVPSAAAVSERVELVKQARVLVAELGAVLAKLDAD